MSGVARLRSLFTFAVQGETHEAGQPFADATLAITNGASGQTTVADGSTDSQLSVSGVSTITGFFLRSDQNISLKLGATGSNAAFTVSAGIPVSMLGVSLSRISVSNSSGYTANIEYAVVGS